MKKRTKIIVFVFVLVVIIAGIFFARYFLSVRSYQNTVENITYVNVDATNVPDGIYIGEYDVDFIYAKVEVTVEGGIITNINLLEHQNERGIAAEGIEQEIVRQQIVDVDAVSGATNSSKVIKKAVDNALSAGNAEQH